ncbi:hypothetical protein OAS86_05375 [Gammaproteobacteria bacterium]|nr:hypothetical protein [Gammaproteobacteria bacterium]
MTTSISGNRFTTTRRAAAFGLVSLALIGCSSDGNGVYSSVVPPQSFEAVPTRMVVLAQIDQPQLRRAVEVAVVGKLGERGVIAVPATGESVFKGMPLQPNATQAATMTSHIADGRFDSALVVRFAHKSAPNQADPVIAERIIEVDAGGAEATVVTPVVAETEITSQPHWIDPNSFSTYYGVGNTVMLNGVVPEVYYEDAVFRLEATSFRANDRDQPTEYLPEYQSKIDVDNLLTVEGAVERYAAILINDMRSKKIVR